MRHHVRQLESVRPARIVGMADPSRRSLQQMVKTFPNLAEVPSFADYRELLDEVEMDGVIIASPHTLHDEHIMAALGAGLHVLTEKPMVCTVAHAKAVMRKAEREDRILMIGYQRHFSSAFRQAREIVASGKIGKLTFVQALQAQNWLRGTRGTWRQDPKLSGGGQLNDSGSHLLDIILWVTDVPPDAVYARVSNRGSKVDILSGLTVTFKGGAIGSIAVVGDAPGWWEDVTFYGEQGALYIRDNRLTMQSQRGPTKQKRIPDRKKDGGSPDKNFVDSILGRAEPQTPPVWGLRVAQLTEAAWESARTGKPVKVKR
jgi:predicted dehydrogenase